MGNFSSATGTITLIMMLLGRTIFQKFGWKFAALVTPTVSIDMANFHSADAYIAYLELIFTFLRLLR